MLFLVLLSAVQQSCYGVLHCCLDGAYSRSIPQSDSLAGVGGLQDRARENDLAVPPGGRNFEEYDAIVVRTYPELVNSENVSLFSELFGSSLAGCGSRAVSGVHDGFLSQCSAVLCRAEATRLRLALQDVSIRGIVRLSLVSSAVR